MPLSNYVDKAGPVVSAAWLNAVDEILNGNGTPGFGVYSAVFQSGYLQYVGPTNNGQNPSGLTNNLTGNTNFIVGTSLPNPSGIPAPAFLIGSGVPQAWIITDAVLAGNDGIDLGITAGETAPGSTDTGGTLQLFGGGADNGQGGLLLVQGGTSVQQKAGSVQIQGGNSTSGIAGDVFIIGGETGLGGGGSVHLIMSNTGSGPAGSLVIRVNSTILYTVEQTGAIFSGAAGAGDGFGNMFMSQGVNAAAIWSNGLLGSSTVQLSGGISGGSVGGKLRWQKAAGFVHIWCDSADQPFGIIGTSIGDNDLIITGLPTFLAPQSARNVYSGPAENATGVTYSTEATVGGNPASFGIIVSLLITLNAGAQVGPGGRNAWSPSGSKGILPGWSVTYAIGQ